MPVLRQAIERNVEIIPEASRRLPDEWKARHPDVPWGRSPGSEMCCVTTTTGVDDTVLWRAATVELQTLKAVVEAMRRMAGRKSTSPRADGGRMRLKLPQRRSAA